MAQKLRSLVALAEDLDYIFSTHMVAYPHGGFTIMFLTLIPDMLLHSMIISNNNA